MNKLLLSFILCFCFLSACAPDPRNAADAYATTSQADQAALNAAQQRSLLNDQHTLAEQQANAQLAASIAAHNHLVTWISLAGSLALGIFILASTVIIIVTMWHASHAIKIYSLRHAEVQANLIPLDPITRQYPLLISFHRGVFSLTNPNIGQTLLLDTHNEADRQAIAASAQVQAAGVLAVEARKAHGAQDIAKIRPTIIDAQESGLQVGEIFNNMVDTLNRSSNE
jgi:16S rRNA G1207 methylase RsmC